MVFVCCLLSSVVLGKKIRNEITITMKSAKKQRDEGLFEKIYRLGASENVDNTFERES